MNLTALRQCFLALLLGTSGSLLFAVEVADDEGTAIVLDAPAERIISLAPSLTELIFAAGAGERLVGVVEYSDYPPQATQIQVVGRHDLLDLERILQLNPDLVVAWQTGNPRASVNRLRQLGLQVYVAEPKSLDSIPSHLERLGRLAGTETIATAAAAGFRTRLDALVLRYSGQAPLRTFYQVWDSPLISAGGNELINDIITLCGGRNIFADIQLVAPKITAEAVLERDPQVIIASGMDIERPEWLDEWRRWPDISAVNHDKLFFVPPALLQRHTPRALEGATQMCQQIEDARQAYVGTHQ